MKISFHRIMNEAIRQYSSIEMKGKDISEVKHFYIKKVIFLLVPLILFWFYMCWNNSYEPRNIFEIITVLLWFALIIIIIFCGID